MIWAVTFNPSQDMTFILNQPWSSGTVSTAVAVYGRAGGKGNNVARVIHVLQQSVTAVGFYGGQTGRLVRAMLEAEDIPVLAAPAADETRTCLTIVDGEGGVTEIRAPGPPVEPSAAANLLRQLVDAVQPDDWVTLSGSLPLGIPAGIWAQWVAELSPRCQGVLVDTSGENLRAAASMQPWLMVPNREEWTGAGLGLVRPLLITEGEHGVSWYPAETDHRYRLRPPAVHVRNTVGAGDALLGGLVSALSQGDEGLSALKYAVAVAAASVSSLAVADVDPVLAAELVPQVAIESDES